MTYFEHCAAIEQTLLILLLFAASLVQLFLTVEDAAGGRYRRLLLDGLLLIGALLLCGDLLGIAGRIDGEALFLSSRSIPLDSGRGAAALRVFQLCRQLCGERNMYCLGTPSKREVITCPMESASLTTTERYG